MNAKLFGLGTLALTAAFGWWIGSILSPAQVSMALGVIFGLMAGIPAALIAISSDRRVRHDVYHHHNVGVCHHQITETPHKPAERISALLPQKTAPVVRIVESDVAMLPSKAQKRIEVSR